MPVLEFLLSKHDVPAIENPLKNFNREASIVSTTRPIFETITTDYSFAMLNAVSSSFCGMELLRYIDLSYEYVVNPDSVEFNVNNSIYY